MSHIKISGVQKVVAKIYVSQGGVCKEIDRAQIAVTSGTPPLQSLKTFYIKAAPPTLPPTPPPAPPPAPTPTPTTPLTVSVSPTQVTARRRGGGVMTTGTASVTVSGSTGALRYSWEILEFDTNVQPTINTPAGVATTFTANIDPSGYNAARARVTVVDAANNSGSADVDMTFYAPENIGIGGYQ